MTDRLVCDDLSQRRADLLAHPTLNGIDFVEIDPADHRIVRVVFVKPVPANGYGFPAQPDRVRIEGGVRITGLRADSVAVVAPDSLRIVLNTHGDLSQYDLILEHPGLDPPLSRTPFSLAAVCRTDIDCRPGSSCPPDGADEPLIDYLAKDYSSFRRLLLDVASARHGTYTDANAADLAMTLIELFAYTADRLSYFQDAVATEAFLDTARQRRSIRRHARLVDYRMHEGRNAWTWAALTVSRDGVLPRNTPLLTRVAAPLVAGGRVPDTVIDATWLDPSQPERFERSPALSEVVVFETAHEQACFVRNNEIQIHTWGNDNCVLARGTRECFLFSVTPAGVARRPLLSDGDFLVLEEVRGPSGKGLPADADVRHRTVVRIEGEPMQATDPLYSNTLSSIVDPVSGIAQWELQRWQAGPTLPLLRVRWRRTDALPFPLCLSTTTQDGRKLRSIAVARGNVVAADHGRTLAEEASPVVPGRIPVELRLRRGPLTQQTAPDDVRYDGNGRLITARFDLAASPGDTIPALVVQTTTTAGVETWLPVEDLLDSTPFARHVVAEPGAPVGGDLNVPPVQDSDAGTGGPGMTLGAGAIVRFGDGTYGASPEAGRRPDEVVYRVVYRVGSGPAGNVGAHTLVHVAAPQPLVAGWPSVTAVRNPLPATGGTSPEPVAKVRVNAPVAFSVDQRRAVTEDDYAAAVTRLGEVQGAVATFRWTGSWLTVLVGVDPADPRDLLLTPDGRNRLAPALERLVRAQLNRYRQAGYDLEVRPPVFVPLEIAVEICVRPGHFRAGVVQAVRQALSAGYQPHGLPGFFHPSRWTFGQRLWLSSLYAAIEAVPGVESVGIVRFRRLGQPDNCEIDTGFIELGPWEIARCDDDPNMPEHGVLEVTGRGGKG